MTVAQEPASEPYHPLRYETWPDDQKEFSGRVWRALHDGDLKPLAAYLRAGHQLDLPLANAIADAIDGPDANFFRIIPKGRAPGQRGFTEHEEARERKLQIGVYMEDRVRRYGRGGYDAALKETCEKFDIKSSATVAKARKYLLGYMARAQVKPGWDQWAFLKDFYFTP